VGKETFRKEARLEPKAIKYLKGSFKHANELGCVKELLMYLQLKQVNPHGKIMYGKSIETIKGLTGYSSGGTCKTLRSTIDKGFIKEFKTKDGKTYCYQLVSYVHAYRRILMMKFRLDRGAIPEHRLIRIKAKFINDSKQLKKIIQASEIKNNIDRQLFRFEQKEQLRKYSKNDIVSQVEEHECVKAAISCRRLREILGYKTTAAILKVLKQLEECSLLIVTRQGIQDIVKMSYQKFKDTGSLKNYSFKSGHAYRYGCNLLQIDSKLEYIYLHNSHSNDFDTRNYLHV